jgi:hypothetical protein
LSPVTPGKSRNRAVIIRPSYSCSIVSNSLLTIILALGAHGSVAGSIPDEVTGSFIDLIVPSRNTALGSTQPLTEMSTRHLPGGKGRPARKVDNLTAICEAIA